MNVLLKLPALIELIKKEISSFFLLGIVFILTSKLQVITIFFLPIFINTSLFYLVRKERSLLSREFLEFFKKSFLRLFLGQSLLYTFILGFLVAFSMIILAFKNNSSLLILVVPLLTMALIIIIMRLSLVSFYLLGNSSLTSLEAIRMSYNNPNRIILYKIYSVGLIFLFLLSWLNFPFLAFTVELMTKLFLVKIFFSYDHKI